MAWELAWHCAHFCCWWKLFRHSFCCWHFSGSCCSDRMFPV